MHVAPKTHLSHGILSRTKDLGAESRTGVNRNEIVRRRLGRERFGISDSARGLSDMDPRHVSSTSETVVEVLVQLRPTSTEITMG